MSAQRTLSERLQTRSGRQADAFSVSNLVCHVREYNDGAARLIEGFIVKTRFRLSGRLWCLVIAFAACGVAAWCFFAVGPDAVVLREQTIDVQGTLRRHRLVIPKSLDEGRPSPLLFAFPGAGDTAEDMSRYTQLDCLAANKKFFLVYLEGRHLSWPPFIPPENPDVAVPDLQFFDALYDELSQQYNIDERRIYAVGISQGGGFREPSRGQTKSETRRCRRTLWLAAKATPGRRNSC